MGAYQELNERDARIQKLEELLKDINQRVEAMEYPIRTVSFKLRPEGGQVR